MNQAGVAAMKILPHFALAIHNSRNNRKPAAHVLPLNVSPVRSFHPAAAPVAPRSKLNSQCIVLAGTNQHDAP
jgi:hypothetical protein